MKWFGQDARRYTELGRDPDFEFCIDAFCGSNAGHDNRE